MKNIQVSDVSLRTLGSVSLSFKEKLEIAKRLSELGVDIIELNVSSSGKADEVLVKTISTCIKKSIICCEVKCGIDDVNRAYSLIAGAKKKRLLVSLPTSPVQMEYFQNKKPAAILELLKKTVSEAVSLCSDVEVSFDDATRAEKEFLYKAISLAIENGAKTITIADLAGLMLADEFRDFISDIYTNVPALKNIELSVQCTDEMSMAVACTISAIMGGASCVKICSAGFGKYISAEKLCSVMDFIGAKKGYSCSINKTAVGRLAKQILELASDNKESSYNISSDGGTEQISSDISQAELNKLIKKRGYDLSADDFKKVYEEFNKLVERKSANVNELEVIIANTAMQVVPTYVVKSFSVNSSNVIRSTASVVLEKEGKEYYGLSYGNGSVDAAFLAIENVVGRHFELDDFTLGSVTEGREAMGQAIVKLRSNGIIYAGRGVSTDIISAAIKAYVNAINKILFEEVNK